VIFAKVCGVILVRAVSNETVNRRVKILGIDEHIAEIVFFGFADN